MEFIILLNVTGENEQCTAGTRFFSNDGRTK
jgi:hypothetical protein